ncbi:MAG TPA: hydroxymethylglutaryl-CoA lyase [Acidimicrobiales bacterium]|nr:hydroxymethylglutaryl-CoA lyase [Acidimicrobiales bacterium]
MRHPPRVTAAGLPARVRIHEVGARDGLQNEPRPVPLALKLELLDRLADCGLSDLEVTSLVRPDRVPQLADAEQLLRRLERRDDVRYSVLVPNRRGLERALALGVAEVAVFASATESFANANLGRSRAESMAEIRALAGEALAAGLALRGYVSMCFGDPWEGEVAEEEVVKVVDELFAVGCAEVSLGDTIGVATPGQVKHLLGALGAAGHAPAALAVHFHDTFGQALANTFSALEEGIEVVDSSVAGLGGCPFAGSATGNLATEDLLWQLEGLGIATGVDLEGLVRTADWVCRALGREERSRTLRALEQEVRG